MDLERDVKALVRDAPHALQAVLFGPDDARLVAERAGGEEEEHRMAVKSG